MLFEELLDCSFDHWSAVRGNDYRVLTRNPTTTFALVGKPSWGADGNIKRLLSFAGMWADHDANQKIEPVRICGTIARKRTVHVEAKH